MAGVHLLVGKLGNGKTVLAVSRAIEYLRSGRPVATNIDLQPDKVLPATARYRLTRLPDFPTGRDLWNLGSGNPDSTNEEKNGLLILDEAVLLLNARAWNAKGREEVIAWLVMSRKQGWDCIIIVQALAALDKQIRETVGEHVVSCRRLDRVKLPVLGVGMPRFFLGIVKYGTGPNAPTVDRWFSSGRDVFPAFPTRQIFKEEDSHETPTYSVLDAWTLRGRYLSEWQLVKAKFWLYIAMCSFAAAVLSGVAVRFALTRPVVQIVPIKAAIIGYAVGDRGVAVVLESGETFSAPSYSLDASGLSVVHMGTKYVEAPSVVSRSLLGR
ncbi:MAG: zonular occludens toxin domain-containing protein [Casimicrobium sp.]